MNPMYTGVNSAQNHKPAHMDLKMGEGVNLLWVIPVVPKAS